MPHSMMGTRGQVRHHTPKGNRKGKIIRRLSEKMAEINERARATSEASHRALEEARAKARTRERRLYLALALAAIILLVLAFAPR